ncbi:MAG: hypothetical protein ABFD29_03705 [Anaerolineaceae bacterium]
MTGYEVQRLAQAQRRRQEWLACNKRPRIPRARTSSGGAAVAWSQC